MASIGMLLNTDRCTGCYSCQTACREANRFGYDEKWMEVVRRDPRPVDGRLRLYHLVAPNLDKCGACYGRDPRPLCTKVCTTGALQVGPVEGLLKLRAKSNVVLYAPKGE
ncbi:MAG TPA: hypothetical protein K8W22_00420 [Gordonibacter urolithinfaciens]|uniref:hypothetical protein n=1 Tax=Gordonibacter TaxID=644652 RepID=UPI001D4F5BF0|nr:MULTISPECIES: hypothetical protein [Gordonibacter]MDN4508432.1 hypothetical protein [Gordonibacter sp. RACS_AR49]HJF61905.1 hypothetical protein [Gordonibacter urolithinfaciens]